MVGHQPDRDARVNADEGVVELTNTLKDFLANKAQVARPSGFEPVWTPSFLKPFQAELLAWSLRMGRGLLLADCGLGKTPIQLSWARNVAEQTDGDVLIVAPLSVGAQFVAEGEKFDIPVARSRDGTVAGQITVTNYEMLSRFNPDHFAGVSLDESSILKNFAGKRRREITEFLRTVWYRLLATATAAPNDYLELGTSAEALGHMGHMDMLATFFINDENSLHPTALGARWRFKRAAEAPYWRWVCSWAKAIRRPSDLDPSYDDGEFALPPLNVEESVVENHEPLDGFLPGIVIEARTLAEQRQERKRNMAERCKLAADLATGHDRPVVIWTDYNEEANTLVRLIPGAKQVSGSMTDTAKEATFGAFAAGELRVLVTKPRIGAWGLNWQHCSDVVFFVSHSFEQYYQAIRRCWRYGQRRPVTVHVIATPGERRVVANLRRKAEQSDRMFQQLVTHMADPALRDFDKTKTTTLEIPQWLT